MAKVIIDNLATILTLDSRQYSIGMRSASKQVASLTFQMVAAAKKVALFGVALSASVTGGGLILLTKRAFATVDALAKTSDVLGIATEDLVALRFAAEQTGVQTQKLDRALGQMTRRISEAAQGTGKAKNALLELGLSAKQLNRDGPALALGKIADALNRLPTVADRVRVAYKLFGAEGVALVTTLRLGSRGLVEMGDEATRLGLTISRTAARGIEEANKAVKRLQASSRGVFIRLATELAPFVEALADAYVDLTKESSLSSEKIVRGFELVALAMDQALLGVKLLQIGMESWKVGALSAIKSVVSAYNESNKFLAETISLIPLVTVTYEDLTTTVRGMEIEIAKAKVTLDRLFRDVSGGGSRNKISKFFDEIREKAKLAAEEFEKTIKQSGAGDIIVPALKDLQAQQKKTQTFARGIGNAFGDAADSAITDIKRIDDAVIQLGRAIQRAIIQAVIVQPIAQGIAAGFGNFFGGNRPAPTPFSPAIGPEGLIVPPTPALALAHGGVVTRPTFAMIGEAGQSEGVLPLATTRGGQLGVQTVGGGGGGRTVVNVTVINQSQEKVDTQSRTNSRGITELQIMIGNQIAGDIRSNGPVGRSISDVFGTPRRGHR